jgi:hypothetical protein
MDIKFIIATSALLLASCSGAESDAKKSVLAVLKDPDSAKFGQFTNIHDKAACLTVNAKNSMGGYTGDKQASLMKFSEKWKLLDIDKLSHEQCVKIMTKVASESAPKKEK